jgi:hypothetical protein
MNHSLELVKTALASGSVKTFTLEDGHEMTLRSVGNGKTMKIDIDDGESHQTNGVGSFVKVIVKILNNRGVPCWDKSKEGRDNIYQVLSMYKDF